MTDAERIAQIRRLIEKFEKSDYYGAERIFALAVILAIKEIVKERAPAPEV